MLATVATSTLPADTHLVTYEEPQFHQLQRPYNGVMSIAHVHLQAVVRELHRHPDIDLVHDHVEVVGLVLVTVEWWVDPENAARPRPRVYRPLSILGHDRQTGTAE